MGNAQVGVGEGDGVDGFEQAFLGVAETEVEQAESRGVSVRGARARAGAGWLRSGEFR